MREVSLFKTQAYRTIILYIQTDTSEARHHFVYFGFLVFCGSYLLSRLKGNRRLSAIGNALVGMFFIGFAARLASETS